MSEGESDGGTARCAGSDEDRPETGAYPSEALFGGRRAIVILHRGERYVLRVTRHGKLILNKWSLGEDERDTTR
jgi:hypothetical protein